MSSQQREIIHLSFGPFSNHIATHFWNTQQSYFTYDSTDLSRSTTDRRNRQDRDNDDDGDHDRADDPLVDHDTSFKAGKGADGQDTYSPRTLIFETQQELGSLRKLNPLYQSLQIADEEEQQREEILSQLAAQSVTTWGSAAHVQSAQRVPKSSYQRRLELEDEGIEYRSQDDDDEGEQQKEAESDQSIRRGRDAAAAAAAAPPTSSTGPTKKRSIRSRFRFWSDYSRVYYHPKSLITVGGQLMAPMSGSYNGDASADDAQDGRTRFDRFEQGHAFFKQLERDSDTLDDNLRWFAEDSDVLQGFQHTINTSDAFGGLAAAYVEAIQDEYPKVTQLVFGAVWGSETPRDDDDRLSKLRRMNNALALASLVESAAMYVPLRAPTSIKTIPGLPQRAGWARGIERIDLDDMHHVGALLSAHLETATLGSRLRTRPESLSSLVSRLNWRRDTPIAHLGGCLPCPISSGATSPRPTSYDPIQALLASRGYAPRTHNGPTESLAEQTKRGAKKLEEAWLDLSVEPETRMTKRESILRGIKEPFAASLMVRDGEVDNVRSILGAVDGFIKLKEPLARGLFTPLPYNLPTSYPHIFPTRPSSIAMISSLSTLPSTVRLLLSAKRTILSVIEGHEPLSEYGLGNVGAGSAANDESDGKIGGRDGLKEVRERLESLIDSYGGDGGDDDEEGRGGVGTDEEHEIQEEDVDLDW